MQSAAAVGVSHRPELAAERFVQEIKTTANLQHPHILPLFDSGSAGGRDGGTEFLYCVMPFIDGETLRDKLDRETQLGIDEAVMPTASPSDRAQPLVTDDRWLRHDTGIGH